MKIILCVLLILLTIGCGTTKKDQTDVAVDMTAVEAQDNQTAVDITLPEAQDNTSSDVTADLAPAQDTLKEFKPIDTGADGIDIDLTTLSATMVYSQVYNMMIAPEDYVGKMVKMQGMMASYYDEAADRRYFACIIQDATACCAQGIEFELAGELKYPDDYPSDGEAICVEGVFETYKEGELTYVTLRKARFL